MENELLCRMCSKQFNHTNLPRLMPKCFHSFCQSCISNKLQMCSEYTLKIMCPLDDIQMDIDDKDINYFPKNISLIKQLKKNSTSISQEESYNNQSRTQDSSVRSILKTIGQSPNNIQNNNSSVNYKQESPIDQINKCPIHSKSLEVICILDSNIICTNCALYGSHKGHDFKSIVDVQKDKMNRTQQIMNIMDKRKYLETKISGKEAKNQFTEFVNKKRQSLSKQVQQKYSRLHEILKISETNFIQKINKNFQILEQRIKQEIKILDDPTNLYKNWLEKAYKQIQCFDKNQNLKEQISYLDYEKIGGNVNLIKQGQSIVLQLEKTIKSLNENKKQIISNLQIEYNNQIEQSLHEIFQINFKGHTIRQNQKQNYCQINNKKQYPSLEVLLLKQNQNNVSSNIKKYRSTNQFSRFSFKRQSYINEIYKIQKSQRISRSPRFQKRSAIKSQILSPKHREQNIKIQFKRKLKSRIPQKYDKLIQSIIYDNLDVLDLTNAQLGQQNVIHILELIRGKKIKVVRLVKNKLTDDSITHIWNHFGNVISLNLSQNFFSQKILDIILVNYKKTSNLKNIILTNNNINIKQKSVKNKLDQIKKLDIVISI